MRYLDSFNLLVSKVGGMEEQDALLPIGLHDDNAVLASDDVNRKLKSTSHRYFARQQNTVDIEDSTSRVHITARWCLGAVRCVFPQEASVNKNVKSVAWSSNVPNSEVRKRIKRKCSRSEMGSIS